MLLFLRRTKYLLKEQLGIDMLENDQKRLLATYWAFIFANLLSAIFVNTFIFAVDGSFRSVVTYNLFVYVAIMLVSFLQGYLGKRFSCKITFQIGIFLYMLFYIVLLIAREQIGSYLAVVGVIYGSGAAFLYISLNVLSLEYSPLNKRSVYLSVQGMITSVSSLLVPFISGFVLDWFMGMIGYILVFSISIAFFILAYFLSTKLANFKTESKNYTWSLIKALPRRKNWIFAFLGESVRGIREAAMGFMLVSLLYSKVNSNILIGSFNMINGILLLIGFYCIAKRLTFSNAKRYYAIGCTVFALSTLLLLYDVSPATIFLVGIISAFFTSFANNSSTLIIYNVMDHIYNSGQKRTESMVLREAVLNFGRTLGIVFLLFIPETIPSFAVALNILGMTQFISLILYYQVKIKD